MNIKDYMNEFEKVSSIKGMNSLVNEMKTTYKKYIETGGNDFLNDNYNKIVQLRDHAEEKLTMKWPEFGFKYRLFISCMGGVITSTMITIPFIGSSFYIGILAIAAFTMTNILIFSGNALAKSSIRRVLKTYNTELKNIMPITVSADQLALNFMSEKYPAVIDNHIRWMGDNIIEKLDQKSLDIHKVLVQISNDTHLLNTDETDAIRLYLTNIIDKIKQSQSNTIDIINKIKEHKNQIGEEIEACGRKNEKLEATHRILANVKQLGFETNELIQKVDSWGISVNIHLDELDAPNMDAIKEATILIETKSEMIEFEVREIMWEH